MATSQNGSSQLPSTPLHLNEDHSFSDAALTFAVDVSGSTQGRTLLAEKNFIYRVASVLSSQARPHAKIIPWNNSVDHVRGLDHLNTLMSSGYTDPAVVLETSTTKTALLGSSVWFLLTDGLIDDRPRERLAQRIAETGIHGTSCVTAIFGRTGTQRPCDCNISVGVSLFAVAPNCLFLYCDVATGDVMIMQSKGIFNVLLQGAENPVIDGNTTWASFPRLPMHSLSDIVVPPARKLSEDEIALQDSLVVNFADLWSNKLSQEKVEQILSNQDNLTSIVMTAQSRNQQQQFQSWVMQQQAPQQNPLALNRTDTSAGTALATMKEILRLIKDGVPVPPELQQRLRTTHQRNTNGFILMATKQAQQARMRNAMIQNSYHRAASRITKASSLTQTAQYSPMKNESVKSSFLHQPNRMVPPAMAPATTWNNPIPHRTRPGMLPGGIPAPALMPIPSTMPAPSTMSTPPSAPQPSGEEDIDNARIRDMLYTTGFKGRKNAFKATCPLCGATDVPMAWLLCAKSMQPELVRRLSNVDFPLSMGQQGVRDIVSSMICCDPCSTYLVSQSVPPGPEVVSHSLPLVQYSENKAAYENVLQKAFGGCFSNEALPQAFLAAMLNADARVSASPAGKVLAPDTFHAAVRWTCVDLLHNSTAQKDLTIPTAQNMSQGPQWSLASVLCEAFARVNELQSLIVSYPLDGFATILRAAPLINVSVDTQIRAIFRRYLYALTEATLESLGAASANPIDENSAADEFSKLLWQTETDKDDDSAWVMDFDEFNPQQLQHQHASAVAPKQKRSPVLFFPVSALRGTVLLNEARYSIFRAMEPFRPLEKEDQAWVGHSTAVFLHGLATVMQNASVKSPPQSVFEATMSLPRVALLNSQPEIIDAERVKSLVLEGGYV